MDIGDLISGLALALAAASFGVNLWVGRRAAIRGRKPVLVFIDEPERGWTLGNIGNGPAVNIVVAQRKDGEWFNPVRVRPMSKDQVAALEWLGRVNDTGLGATYFDAEGRAYTSTLGAEVLRIYEGGHLPPWDEHAIRRYWDVPRYDPAGTRWGAERSPFRC